MVGEPECCELYIEQEWPSSPCRDHPTEAREKTEVDPQVLTSERSLCIRWLDWENWNHEQVKKILKNGWPWAVRRSEMEIIKVNQLKTPHRHVAPNAVSLCCAFTFQALNTGHIISIQPRSGSGPAWNRVQEKPHCLWEDLEVTHRSAPQLPISFFHLGYEAKFWYYGKWLRLIIIHAVTLKHRNVDITGS